MEENRCYSISEAAEKVNMSISAIRYYDYQGILSFIQKDEAGRRIFTEDDIALLMDIKELKEYGMSLRELKIYVSLCQKPDSLEQRVEFIRNYEAALEMKIEKEQWNLEMLRFKIESIQENEDVLKTGKIRRIL